MPVFARVRAPDQALARLAGCASPIPRYPRALAFPKRGEAGSPRPKASPHQFLGGARRRWAVLLVQRPTGTLVSNQRTSQFTNYLRQIDRRRRVPVLGCYGNCPEPRPGHGLYNVAYGFERNRFATARNAASAKSYSRSAATLCGVPAAVLSHAIRAATTRALRLCATPHTKPDFRTASAFRVLAIQK
jgi:hypothetical protein